LLAGVADIRHWTSSQYTATGVTNQQFSLVPVGATCGADTVLADIAAASVD
jgi:hypothetical protein